MPRGDARRAVAEGHEDRPGDPRPDGLRPGRRDARSEPLRHERRHFHGRRRAAARPPARRARPERPRNPAGDHRGPHDRRRGAALRRGASVHVTRPAVRRCRTARRGGSRVRARGPEAPGATQEEGRLMELHERLAQAGSEPALLDGNIDPFAEVKNKIHLAIVSELGPRLFEANDSSLARARVEEEIRSQLKLESGLSREDRDHIASEISDDIFGYGPLERLLPDQTISEIMVNGPHEIWIERRGLLSRIPLKFSDESHLRRIITKMVGQVGRRIDESSPMVEARLPDGSRIHAIIPPLSLTGPLLTIRKFPHNRYDLDELIDIGTLSPEAAVLLSAGVKADLNMLISGGTGTGKTTLLNALSGSVPEGDRTITIEDAAELQLTQEHVLRLEARPKNIEGEGEITIRDLVRNALRMRPDRIIVGEVRGAEALDMLQAMNTGHEGSLSTIHANSSRDALSRLETMVLMAGYDLPLRAIRQQVASALDLIIHP